MDALVLLVFGGVPGEFHLAQRARRAARFNVRLQARAARGASACKPLLDRDAHVVVQVFRGEIRSVRPHQRVELWMNHERLKKRKVPERFEHWTFQRSGQINLPSETVAKPEPQHVPTDVPRFENVVIHGSTPTV